MSLIEEAKELIDGMMPWDALAVYMTKVRSIMDSRDEAFASVVEAGAFRLEMKRGELHWEFFMPKTSAAATACRKEVIFMWEEFVPGMEFTCEREVSIPYRMCGDRGFESAVRSFLPETMAVLVIEDINAAGEKIRISDLDSIKIQVKDMIESGRFENKFETYLHIDTKSPYDFYRIAKEIRTALEYTLCDLSDGVRRFLSCGQFTYDCSVEGDNLLFNCVEGGTDLVEDFTNRVKFELVVVSARQDYEPRSESITIKVDSSIK